MTARIDGLDRALAFAAAILLGQPAAPALAPDRLADVGVRLRLLTRAAARRRA
jgi:hypothetical protein